MKKILLLACIAILPFAASAQMPAAAVPSTATQAVDVRIFSPDTSKGVFQQWTFTAPPGASQEFTGRNENPTPADLNASVGAHVAIKRIGTTSTYKVDVTVTDSSKGGFAWRSEDSEHGGIELEPNADATRLFIAPGWSMTLKRLN